MCTPLPRTSSRRKDGTSSIHTNTKCCICSKRKTKKGGSGYEKLEKCLTEPVAKTLQKFALVKESPVQLMMVIGLDREKIVAKEFYYHRTCYRNYTRSEKMKDDSTRLVELDAFFGIVIERVIDNGEVIDMVELSSILDEVLDLQTLKQRLSTKFGDDIGFWSPLRYEKSFIYSERIPKGQIIEVGSCKIKKASSVPEASINQKITEVVRSLRKEVIKMTPSFLQWPPSEDQLLNANVDVPPLLKHFLSELLSTKMRLSSNKERVVEGLAQDIIFRIQNGRYKPLCTKKKTGLKQVIQWLNKLGHGISYADVNCLETSLAESQMCYKVLKTFVPSYIQPSQFVTFVWDNNDINPESLSGVSMHCTNGIIIQLPNSSSDLYQSVPDSTPVRRSEPKSHNRKRSFQAVYNDLEPYYIKKRDYSLFSACYYWK